MFTSPLTLRFCLAHSEHCHWYVLDTRATAVWTVTSECPDTAVEAFLSAPLGSFWHPQTTPSQKAEQSPTTSDLSCRSCGLDAACILFYGSNILVSDELACRGEGLYLFCVSEIRGLTTYCTDCVSFTNTPHAHPVHARLLPLRKARALAGQLLGKV